MINTTLVRLDEQAARAGLQFGTTPLGELPPDRVRSLLLAFSTIDPVDNFDADPEIRLESPAGRVVVRTIRGSLLASDPGATSIPSNPVSAGEIVARLAADIVPTPEEATPAHEPDELTYIPPPSRAFTLLRPYQRVALAAVAAALAVYLAYPTLAAPSRTPAASFVELRDASNVAARRSRLAGVYLTGNQPGQHGIALNADGTLKIFQINAGSQAPSFIADTYRIGQLGGTECLVAPQLGAPILTAGPERLSFGGEFYLRIR